MTDEPTYSTFLGSGVQPPGSQPDSLGSLRRLGQYRIVKQLGHGGMGVVYQAEDTHLNRLAALKVMRADYAADKGARARFIREAQAAARLKHDHIVTIYQVGEENDVPFLAMEFLTGKSLEDWLRPDRRATVMEALLISKQVARGLAAAHAANLIHRDIKPANLWLEAPRGRVKILDFGLARYSGADYPALTQDGSVIGTPAFMAPEQARGDIIDHRCDLFSLGCVMYRMLTGRLPFQGNTLYAVLSAIASETPPSPAIVRPETPQPLSDLVDQLLAKNPDDRPASAQAVLEELVAIEQQTKQPQSPQSLLGSQPTLPAHVESPSAEAAGNFPILVSASSASRSRPPRRKNRSYGYAALALLATGLAVAGVIMSFDSDPSQHEQGKDRTLARVGSEAGPVAKTQSLHERLELAPQSATADGWVNLFNGRDLTGWTPVGDSASWRAEDNVLRVEGDSQTGWLRTDKVFSDFELRLEFKLPPSGNTGVFLRAPYEFSQGSVLEVQIQDDAYWEPTGLQEWQRTGAIYGVVAPNPWVQATSKVWHNLAISAVGSRVTVTVDGQQVVDEDMDKVHVQHKNPKPHLRRRSGHIGLQQRVGTPVDFRNLQIRELGSGDER